jgi:hypothetical protein
VGASIEHIEPSLNRKGIPKGKTFENLRRQIFIGLPLGVFLCERFFSREKKCEKKNHLDNLSFLLYNNMKS